MSGTNAYGMQQPVQPFGYGGYSPSPTPMYGGYGMTLPSMNTGMSYNNGVIGSGMIPSYGGFGGYGGYGGYSPFPSYSSFGGYSPFGNMYQPNFFNSMTHQMAAIPRYSIPTMNTSSGYGYVPPPPVPTDPMAEKPSFCVGRANLLPACRGT